MKILFFSHYFTPEGNAPATRVHAYCKRWVAAGHDVTVITGVPNVPSGAVYDGYANRRIQFEEIDGIKVTRVWTYLAANKGTALRILNYLSFMVSSVLACRRSGKPDLVIATSPQFFCGWAGACASRLHNVPFVLEIRDIWPESIVTVGAMKRGVMLRVLERLERWLYALATRIITVGEGYRQKLLARGVPENSIAVVSNGVEPAMYEHVDGAATRKEWGIGDEDFVCAYVGTIGMASGLDIALKAARSLQSAKVDGVKFLLVGDGALREQLEEEATRSHLSDIIFTGRVDKQHIPRYLAACDVCLVHLRKADLFQTVMPSKIFEAAAASRPIILGVEGYAAALVQKAEAGMCIEPENEVQLIDTLNILRQDRARVHRMGEAAKTHIATAYDYDALVLDYTLCLEELLRENT